jgi:SAM-dependent methyltransferase
MEFKDHFSGCADSYAATRPRYPAELLDWVAALPAARRLAWDCATGSGQAALGLAGRFARVVATDASERQIANAVPHPRIEYRTAPAEASGLADGSADLVAVAQALHWFDFDRFYAEVRRVLAPGGALAAWTYNLARISPELDPLIDRLARGIVGPYWPPERRWVDEDYRTVPFPFAEVPAPAFELAERWDLARFLRYFDTWSSVGRYRKATGRDPVAEVRDDLAAAWGDPAAPRLVRWPIRVRAGRVPT